MNTVKNKTRFINFEGIHGSGKSTTSWILNKKLHEQGVKSQLYLEVDLDNAQKSPCDLRFYSVLNNKQYSNLINSYKIRSDLLDKLTEKIDKYYLIYYPDLKNVDNELLEKIKHFQAYEGQLDSNIFIELMLKRFDNFVQKALKNDYIYIFESVLFQYIINELMRFSDLSESDIANTIYKLSNILKPLNPVIYHLRTNNIKKIIDKIADERKSDNYELYPDWIDWMVQYVKNSRYGEKNDVKNRDDLMNYFYKRYEIEKKAFDLLDIKKYIINIDEMSKEELNMYVYKMVMY